MRLAPLLFFVVIAFCAACGGERDTDIDTTFDPCARIELVPTNATASELASIRAAAAMWNKHGTSISIVGDQPDATVAIPIEFERAAPMFRGVYRDELGDVVINRVLSDEDQRAVVVAHELGHAFGLEHNTFEDSVMAEGNIDVGPAERDVDQLAELWPDCDLEP